MPSEFFCFRCGQIIPVPDGFPHRTIPCQQCGDSMPIPTPGTYGTPPGGMSDPTVRRVEQSEPVPTAFTMGEVFSDSWNIGAKCWQQFLMLGAIVGIVNLGAVFIGLFCVLVPLILAGSAEQFNDPIMVGFLIVWGLTVFLLASLVMVWIYAGAIAYTLAVVRGEQPLTSVMFGGMKHFWGVLIVGANVTVILLCVWFVIFMVTWIPPMFYLAADHDPSPTAAVLSMTSFVLGGLAMFVSIMFFSMVFCLSNFFVVDCNQGPVDAMKSSYRFVWSQFWTVLVCVLVIGLLVGAASQIPVVGFFLATPLTLFAYTVMYLKITGQPLAAP